MRFLLILIAGCLLALNTAVSQPLTMYVFASVDCPYCEAQKPFPQIMYVPVFVPVLDRRT